LWRAELEDGHGWAESGKCGGAEIRIPELSGSSGEDSDSRPRKKLRGKETVEDEDGDESEDEPANEDEAIDVDDSEVWI
jgi:hypothetical protein